MLSLIGARPCGLQISYAGNRGLGYRPFAPFLLPACRGAVVKLFAATAGKDSRPSRR